MPDHSEVPSSRLTPHWISYLALAIVIAVSLNETLMAQTPLPSVPDSRYARLARGVNLNNWLGSGRTVTITTADRDMLIAAGFTYVRIQLTYDEILPQFAGQNRINTELKDLDAAIDMLSSGGLAVMLDFFPYQKDAPFFFSPAGASAISDAWKTLAARYSSRDPESLFFALINEPHGISQADWDVVAKSVLATIRELAPAHTVLVPPVNFSSLANLLQMQPYADGNVIYVLHDYDPVTFTQQGTTFTGDSTISKLVEVPYPAYLPELQTQIDVATDANVKKVLVTYQQEDWDATRVDWSFQLASTWASLHGVRVAMTEFGAFQQTSDVSSRLRYLRDMRVAAEKYGIGWCLWDYYSSDTPSFDLAFSSGGSRRLDTQMLGALGMGPWQGVQDPPRTGTPPAFTAPLLAQSDKSLQSGSSSVMVAADLNGDGFPDLISARVDFPSTPPLPMEVYLNAGNGVFYPSANLFDGPVPTLLWPMSIAVGKFDESGRPGFFIADRGPLNGSGAQSRLVMPSGTNHFRDATSSIPQKVVGTPSAAAADINGDGIDDLAVFQFGATQIWRNDGTGSFSIDPLGIPSGVSGASCGVFLPKKDGGPPDLAVFGTQSQLLLNDGKGHFKLGTAPPRPPAPFTSPIGGTCAVAGDLNNDGNMDIIVAFGGNATIGTDYIQLLVNNGDGTFRDDSAARITQPARGSQGVNTLYLVPASERQLRTLFLIRNDGFVVKVDSGNGIFADVADFSPPPVPFYDFVPSDFRGTGLNDLIFGQVGSNTLQGMYALRPLNPTGVAAMADASPVLARAVNGGSFSAAIAPGSWVTLFGQNLIPQPIAPALFPVARNDTALRTRPR